MLGSKYPPAPDLYEYAETTSKIALQLCHGWSSSEIISWLEDNEMPTDDLDEVREEYARLVPKASEDANRIEALHDALTRPSRRGCASGGRLLPRMERQPLGSSARGLPSSCR